MSFDISSICTNGLSMRALIVRWRDETMIAGAREVGFDIAPRAARRQISGPGRLRYCVVMALADQ